MLNSLTYKIFGETYDKQVFPFTTFGELDLLPKTTIRQTKPKNILGGHVVNFINEKKKRGLL